MLRNPTRLRFLSGCLSAVLLLGCCACEKTDVPAEATTEENTVTETTTATAETTAAETYTEITTKAAAEPETTAAEETTEEATTEEVKLPQTKAEIVALYNEGANRVKPEAKSVTLNYNLKTQVKEAEISSAVIEPIANKLIGANMGYDESGNNVTFTTYAEKVDAFTVEKQTWASKLTAADISKATCTEKDGVYTVTLWIVADTVPNIKIGEGHAGKCISIVTKDDIVTGAGSLGMSVIDEKSINVTYQNCKITAKIDKQTGNLLAANYYQNWTLALTALGIDVALPFGIEKDYTIHW